MKKFVVVINEFDSVLEMLSAPADFVMVTARNRKDAVRRALKQKEARRGYEFVVDSVYIDAQ